MEAIQQQLEKADEHMQKAYAHTDLEFSRVRAGRATPTMLDNVQMLYYGNMVPLNQVAAITSADARTLMIKPWEKSSIADIERAIIHSNLGFRPQNDGEVIRIIIPPLTEERRKELVKQVKNEAEKGKVAIRNVRKDIKEAFKQLQKEGASEDLVKRAEEKLQTATDKYIQKIDQLLAHKEQELMAV